METLLAIDGDSFAHRAYHSMPKSIRYNAVVGFTNMLVGLYQQSNPDAVLVAWDTLEVPTYRHEAYEPYQSGRIFDPSLLEQLALLPSLCEAFGFAVGKGAGYEADDFLAAAAAGWPGEVLVATSDRDAFQLVDDRVTILQPVKGVSEIARIGVAEVRERYGVDPEQVPDLIALRGDPSDNLPGARGIGAKTAAALLLRHGHLEGVLEHASAQAPARRAALEEHGDELRRFLAVATMRRDLDVPLPPDHVPAWRAGAAEARRRGMDGLASRLDARADA